MSGTLILNYMPLEANYETALSRFEEAPEEKVVDAVTDAVQTDLDDDEMAHIKREMREVLDDLYGRAADPFSGFNTLVVMELDGKPWAFCGGTSVGDTPGGLDAFTALDLLKVTYLEG